MVAVARRARESLVQWLGGASGELTSGSVCDAECDSNRLSAHVGASGPGEVGGGPVSHSELSKFDAGVLILQMWEKPEVSCM